MKRSGVSFLVLLALLVASQPVLAGTTGKIAGAVIDAQTGEALVPANIILEGTVLGGVSNEQGDYFIINVPAGTYTVVAKMIGFTDIRKQDVVVFPDFTTTVNFDMQQTAFELGEAIEVVEERPLIQPDRTQSAVFITNADITALPVRGYAQAASVASGVVDYSRDLGQQANSTEESRSGNTLIVRGGRPNQVGYFVDGFLQQDLLTGISSTAINQNAISEVVFQKGGFEAEYGRFQSGIVNVITREGGGDYFGSLEGITDQMQNDNTKYGLWAATVGGPIVGDHTFFGSVERLTTADRNPSAATREMSDLARGTLGQLGGPTVAEQDVLNQLENNTLPANGFAQWNWQGKLGFKITDDARLLLGTQGSIDKWQQYRHGYLFNTHHAPKYEDRNLSGFARYTHNVSASSFFEVGANHFYTERKRGDGAHFDELARYARPNGNPRFDQFGDLFFNTNDPETLTERNNQNVILGGDEDHLFDDYLRRISYYTGVSFDMTQQIDRRNQLKYGGDYLYHTLRRYNHFFPVQLYGDDLALANTLDVDHYGLDEIAFHDNTNERDGDKHPTEFSAFLQDKFEYEGLVVKAGLRYDYFDTDTEAVVDQARPLDGCPDCEGAVPGRLDDTDLTENKTYHRVSPRIGVAFPVSQSTNLHFNYGKFFQPSTLENLYVSYKFLEHKVLTGGYFVDFGNPNLEPEETTAYEAGFAQALGSASKMEVTAYYKTVKDLVQVRNIESLSSTTKAYASYLNTDFGTIKGVDFDFQLRRTARLQTTLAYSLSFADGTGSIPGTQRNIAWTAGDPPKQTAPLDFDQLHKMSLNFDYRFGPGDGGRVWENFGTNVLFTLASGTPFTPTRVYNEITLANVASQPDGPLNSRYGPYSYRVDLKIDKGFQTGRTNWNVYLWVLNVANRNNAFQVYTSSGNASTTRFLTTDEGQSATAGSPDRANADGEAFYQLGELNPLNFGIPRQFRLGLRLGF